MRELAVATDLIHRKMIWSPAEGLRGLSLSVCEILEAALAEWNTSKRREFPKRPACLPTHAVH